MSRSHASAPPPSFLLALVALGIVARLRPGWLAVELKAACAEHDVSPERLSRLVSRAISLFEPLVARLTRRGRPPRQDDEDGTQSELAITRALLEVATAMLARLKLRRRVVGELVVGTWERLRERHDLSQKRFCETLSIPVRTLRHWLRQPQRQRRRDPKPPSSKPPSPRLRRGRFGFDVLLPGTQVGADTTDLRAFGVQLKLVAAQDIGARDEALFDAIVVDDHESAELVVDVLSRALADKPGAQAITDQGTPYLAEATRRALDALDAEHAPQREGDPLGKSTVERAFGTLKAIAAPLLALTDRVADRLPALRQPELAKALTHLLVAALLRAYQHGARAARAALEAREGIDPDELARRAEHSRERARAHERSKRQLLEHLHEVYRMPGSRRRFVEAYRRYPLTVLHDTERAYAAQAHRDDIRAPMRYFAAIVRRFDEEHRRDRQRRHHDSDQQREIRRQHEAHAARRAAFDAEPLARLRHALELLAHQWLPATASLLLGGEGAGLGHLRGALRRLAELHPDAIRDLALGAFDDFRLAFNDHVGPAGIDAIAALLARELHKVSADQNCAAPAASAILARTGKKPRPPPDRLPI
jgi:hypothetical protein